MIEETARVVAVDTVAVWIEARRESACGRCALQSGCGHGLLDRMRRAPVIQLRLPRLVAGPTLEVGDRVVLGISEHAVLSGSMRMYALPLGGLLSGTLMADGASGTLPIANGDLLAVVGGLAGLLVGLAAVFVLEQRRPMELPRVLRVLAGSVDRPGVHATHRDGPAGPDAAAVDLHATIDDGRNGATTRAGR